MGRILQPKPVLLVRDFPDLAGQAIVASPETGDRPTFHPVAGECFYQRGAPPTQPPPIHQADLTPHHPRTADPIRHQNGAGSPREDGRQPVHFQTRKQPLEQFKLFGR